MASTTSPKEAQLDNHKDEEIFANKKLKIVPIASTKNVRSKQINFDELPGRASLQNKPDLNSGPP
jgi:hypothetical protein